MTYTKLSKEDFESFLAGFDLEFKRRTDLMMVNNFSEYVYSTSIEKGFDIVIYSSVSTHTNKVRAKGTDAIHLKVHHERVSEPVFSESKTLRTENWDENLRKKIESVISKVQEARPCNDCQGYLIRREGKFGAFFGCINYPDCEYSE